MEVDRESLVGTGLIIARAGDACSVTVRLRETGLLATWWFADADDEPVAESTAHATPGLLATVSGHVFPQV